MPTAHVKKDDQVVIIAGTERGKRGRVLQVLHGQQRVIVEGARIIKRHTKKNRNPNAPQGAIIQREGTIALSNVMRADLYDARMARHGKQPPQPAEQPAT